MVYNSCGRNTSFNLPLILSLICNLSVASCGVQTQVVGNRNCTINNWEQVNFSFRDVIPGVESDVIRERFYFVEGKVLDDPICEGIWLLEIDTISIPMVMRNKKDGVSKWTGTRYYLDRKKTLSKKDSVLRKIIKKYNKGFLATKNNPFFSLCRTIVGQQISTKAADSIWAKFEKKCKNNITPKIVLKISLTPNANVLVSSPQARPIKTHARHWRKWELIRIRPKNWESASVNWRWSGRLKRKARANSCPVMKKFW